MLPIINNIPDSIEVAPNLLPKEKQKISVKSIKDECKESMHQFFDDVLDFVRKMYQRMDNGFNFTITEGNVEHVKTNRTKKRYSESENNYVIEEI